MIAMALSGACALLIPFAFGHSLLLLTPLAWAWGFFVIADSAQFSALVTEAVPPHAVGTALTVQTSLGFLLTMVSIQLIPPLVSVVGWRWVFPVLAVGPAFGIAAIRRLVRFKRAVAFVVRRSRAVAISLVVALVVGTIVLLSASGFEVARALGALVRGSVGSWYAFGSGTLIRATPLILTGLAVAVAFQRRCLQHRRGRTVHRRRSRRDGDRALVRRAPVARHDSGDDVGCRGGRRCVGIDRGAAPDSVSRA